jgi:hypothetical protein
MDHWEEKLGMATTYQPLKFPSMEEIFAPFLTSSSSGNKISIGERSTCEALSRASE